MQLCDESRKWVNGLEAVELRHPEKLPVCFAARNKSDKIRLQSSSGGVFHALASYVIEGQGGVVYGCAFDTNLRAEHIRCESMAEVGRCMGSKYSQSDMRDSIRCISSDLESGRTVLFTGTPCQTAAVRATCAAIGKGTLLSVDIICHGVPSPEVFQSWLAELEMMRGEQIANYEHRPKSMGWGHFERITWKNGVVEQDTNNTEAWKRIFYGNKMLRPSCYVCPYTVVDNRPSDLTIADFWGVESTQHTRRDDKALGVSLILANSEAGLRILPELDIDYEIASLDEALPKNPLLQRPSTYKGNRDDSWHELYAHGVLGMARSQRYLISPFRYLVSRAKRQLKQRFGR